MKAIFVPSDFSKNANTALRYAIRLSELLKTELIVFHCAHMSPYILASASASAEQVNKLIREDEAFKLDKLRSQVNKAYAYLGYKKIPASVKLIVESNPLLVDNIIEAAMKHNTDLIVAGTHGASGLNRFFFGSNTAALISRSPIPVLAIPGKYRYTKIKKIAFSSDLENIGHELKRLLPFAQSLQASIDILYLDYGIDVDQMNVKKAVVEIGKTGYKKINLIKQPATIEYSLVKQVKKFLAKNKHQWLVMFTKDRGFWDKLFYGGKTEFMSYSVSIPLLSFKKTGS